MLCCLCLVGSIGCPFGGILCPCGASLGLCFGSFWPTWHESNKKWSQERVKRRPWRTATPFWCVSGHVRKSMRNRFATGEVKTQVLGPRGAGEPPWRSPRGTVPQPLALCLIYTRTFARLILPDALGRNGMHASRTFRVITFRPSADMVPLTSTSRTY